MTPADVVRPLTEAEIDDVSGGAIPVPIRFRRHEPTPPPIRLPIEPVLPILPPRGVFPQPVVPEV
jgi:hypothetical protein